MNKTDLLNEINDCINLLDISGINSKKLVKEKLKSLAPKIVGVARYDLKSLNNYELLDAIKECRMESKDVRKEHEQCNYNRKELIKELKLRRILQARDNNQSWDLYESIVKIPLKEEEEIGFSLTYDDVD